MKKVFVLVGIVVSMVIIACSSNKTPTQVVKDFITACEKGDQKSAEQFLAPVFLREVQGFDSEWFERYKKAVASNGKIISITVEEEFAGEVKIMVLFEDDQTIVKLKRADDKWKITYTDMLSRARGGLGAGLLGL